MWNKIKKYWTRSTCTINSSDPDLVGFLNSRTSETGLFVDNHLATSVPALYRGIEVTGDFVSSLPRQVLVEKNGFFEQTYDHPAHWLLNVQPNPHTNAHKFWKIMQQDKMFGNAYIRIMWAPNGVPTALYRLDPRGTHAVVANEDNVIVGFDLSPLEYGDPELRVVYITQINGHWKQLESWEVMHSHGLTDASGIRGLQIVDNFRDSIGQCAATIQYTAKFFKNGARVPYYWEAPIGMTPEDRIKAQDQLKKGGGINSSTAPIMPNGLKASQLGFTPKDLLLTDLMNQDLVTCALITGLPASWLNSLVNVSYGSLKEDFKKLLAQSIDPHCDAWEGELWKLLSTEQQNSLKWKIEFDRSELENTNRLENSAQWLKEFQAGLRDANEYREAIGLPPRKEEVADQLLLPQNQGFAEIAYETAQEPPEPPPMALPGPQDQPAADQASEAKGEAGKDSTGEGKPPEAEQLRSLLNVRCEALTDRIAKAIQSKGKHELWDTHGETMLKELKTVNRNAEQIIRDYLFEIQEELRFALPEQVKPSAEKLLEVIL